MRRVALLAALVCAVGCTGPGPAPSASPGDVVQSTANELPASFPDDLPLPDGYTVLYSVSYRDARVVYFGSDASAPDLRTHFIEQLPEAGWTLTTCTTADVTPEPLSVVIAANASTIATIQIGTIQPPGDVVTEPIAFLVSLVGGSGDESNGDPSGCR